MFKWCLRYLKKDQTIKYKLVDVEIEADELEGEVTFHLIDGTIVKYKLKGKWNYDSDVISLITGERVDWNIYYKDQINNKHMRHCPIYNNPNIYDYFVSDYVQYNNEQNVVVKVNRRHIIQESIDIKPTGVKLKTTYQKVEKI